MNINKKVKIITETELVKINSIADIIGEHGDRKYLVRTKNGISYTVNKVSCEILG